MNTILCNQLALDYCCAPDDVADRGNYFTEHAFLEGRRTFREGSECYLKLAVVNGKALFTGRRDIIEWCRKEYETYRAEWFMEAKNLRGLNDRIHRDGYQISLMHPFYIAETLSETDTTGYEIRWYYDKDIEQFRGDNRFTSAFTFLEEAPDMIGVSAMRDGNILGMAGASADSPTMWQIGINVEPEARESGIATMLVKLIKTEILKQGILPFYGTAFSHLASQKVALSAGF